MLKIKTRLRKSNLATTSSITGQHGRTERRSVSHQTSTSTTKKTGASKKLSNSTHQDSNIQVESGNGISVILPLKVMEYLGIGLTVTRSIGLCVALNVYQNNFLTGHKVLIPLDDVLFAKVVTKNLLEKRGVWAGGSANTK